MTDLKQCPICGNYFKPRKSNQIYCNKACTTHAYYRRNARAIIQRQKARAMQKIMNANKEQNP